MMNDTSASPLQVWEGDCRELLPAVPTESVDLVFTSPPYADNRMKTYGGVPPDQYVDWFLPVGGELLRTLKPTGSFVLNIKEKTVDGERSTYVIDLIRELRNIGWRWTEEYIWYKKNSVPGKWPNRFRDAWERLLHFTKSRHFSMYQDAVRVPIGSWAQTRFNQLSESDTKRQTYRTLSNFGVNHSHWIGKETVYPTNVLHLATECGNKKHSAVFPESLPEWFIKLFTVPGDTVLDPFLGSGTTGAVCRRLDRHFIGIELHPNYAEVARERIFGQQLLF